MGILKRLFYGIVLLTVFSCAPARSTGGYAIASWYGPGFNGKLTASGERYNMHALTCAHKQYPFGTTLNVTNVENGKSVRVTVNDRGPFVRGRDIDLSYAAAKKIGIVGPGVGKVRLRVIGREGRYVKYIEGDVRVSGKKGPFTVQVGSFKESSNAAHMKRGLKLKYKRVYVTRAFVNGKTFYRVRIGKFKTYESAFDYAKALAEEGYGAVVMRSK